MANEALHNERLLHKLSKLNPDLQVSFLLLFICNFKTYTIIMDFKDNDRETTSLTRAMTKRHSFFLSILPLIRVRVRGQGS